MEEWRNELGQRVASIEVIRNIRCKYFLGGEVILSGLGKVCFWEDSPGSASAAVERGDALYMIFDVSSIPTCSE